MRGSPKSTITTVLAATLLLAPLGCGTDYEEEEADFPAGSGQERTSADVAYAPGPYGYAIGSVIPNLSFMGYAHPETDVGTPLVRIDLAEFYNPTSTGVYPPGSVMGEGAPKPVALLIDMSGVWCPVCQDEAQLILPSKYTLHKPQGGEFLVNLADSFQQGVPATQFSLDGWVQNFDVPFPLVLDPRYRLFIMAPEPVWPTNYIVDTRTMRIVMAIAGAPLPSQYCAPNDTTANCRFWSVYEEVIAGTHTFDE